jgi:hypothetical protein
VALRQRIALISALLTAPALAAPSIPAPQAPAPLSSAVPRPLVGSGETELLERSWRKLDAELRALDQLLPVEPEPAVC